MVNFSMLLGIISLVSLIVHCNSKHLTQKLNHVWTDRELNSELAKTIRDHQSKCTSIVNFFARPKNFGMGSDLHVWSQALCNSMQTGNTLIQMNDRWLWNDMDFCNDSDHLQPLSCYFNLQLVCAESEPVSMTPIIYSNKLDMCQKYIQDVETRQLFRAAAMEYLFSNLNPRLVAETEKAIVNVFGEEGIPENLITVHMRLGDKASEMKLVSEAEYINAVDALITNCTISDPHIYITTESLSGLEKFKEVVKARGKNWKLYYHLPAIFDSTEVLSPMSMAARTKGATGKHSLIALLLALEARYYVLTSGSNWSRLIDELRKNVVDVDCNGCTRIVDLREAEGNMQNWRT